MKAASPALIAYLNSGTQFLMADLYTLTLNGGYTLRYTGADMDLTAAGNLFKSFLIARSKTRSTVGLEVDTLEVTVNPGPGDTLNGVPWIAAARNGALDGATLQLEKIFMPSWGDTSLGSIVLFSGRVSDLDCGRTAATLTIKSELELLDTQLPRNFYQSGCGNTLFDSACGLNRAAFAVNGAATNNSVTQVASALANPSDYFTLGTIVFTSGANAGVTRSVRQFANGVFTLALPLLAPVQNGDTFTAYPGCDKVKATCESKFANVVHFRGFPFVPDPETAT
jgi:uncharacterized phage protein (TIGR02218 family)